MTGSAGFVGRYFVRRLAELGYQISQIDKVGPIPVDARDYFRHAVDPFDLVIHAAAVVGGRARIEGDPLSLAVNLEIDSAMFRWAARVRPGRVVYFSSSAAYSVRLQDAEFAYQLQEGDLEVDPSSRCFGVDFPDGTYGWAKVTGEYLAAHLRQSGVPVTVIRPFSGYGTDQSPDYPFRAFIDRALRGESPFQIWGDGRQVRDWIHIDDIVELTMAAVRQEHDGPLNACTGIPTSFLELADMVLAERWRLSGGSDQFEIETLPDRPQGVQYRVGDPAASTVLREPAVSLEEGIRRALEGRL